MQHPCVVDVLGSGTVPQSYPLHVPGLLDAVSEAEAVAAVYAASRAGVPVGMHALDGRAGLRLWVVGARGGCALGPFPLTEGYRDLLRVTGARVEVEVLEVVGGAAPGTMALL